MSPRTKEQNEEIRIQRMNQILSAAAEVYLRKGIMMEIRDVAAVAGLGYGTVYHYYKNKFALLDDLLWQAFERGEKLTQETLPGTLSSDSPTERLKIYATGLLEAFMAEHSVFILYKMITENFYPLDRTRFTKLHDSFRDRLYRPVVELAGSSTEDPEHFANMLFGSLVGYAGLHIYHGNKLRDKEQIIELLMKAL